jgi:hypothetical protein
MYGEGLAERQIVQLQAGTFEHVGAALLPNWPAVGGTKQDAPNQCVTERWPAGRFPLQIRLGNPPAVLVFDGSKRCDYFVFTTGAKIRDACAPV